MSYEQKYNLRDLILQRLTPQTMYESAYCWIPMFHGTSSAIIALSSEERNKRLEACRCIIDYSYPLLQNFGIGQMTLAQIQTAVGPIAPLVKDAYICAGSIKNGSTWYEYGSAYTTFDPDVALRYANRANICGELGYIAYHLYLGLERCGIAFPSMTKEEEKARELLLNAAREPSEPIVYMYIGIEKQRIRKENGQPVSWDKQISLFLDNIHHGNLRILDDFDITSGMPVDLASIPRIDSN